MSYQVLPVPLQDILTFRELFLQERNTQIRYDACHIRGWSDSYLLLYHEQPIGYGSVKGKEELSDRDAVFEFFLLPSFRKHAYALFEELITLSKADYIECQSNDPFLSSLQFEFGKNIYSDTILFKDHIQTAHELPGVIFRRKREGDEVFGKKPGQEGMYVLEQAGEIVADGGFLTHYNMPFADLYMETKKECWNQGFGSLVLQEIKRECYAAGRVPAARCNINNKVSKATLLKAGFAVAGYMLIGKIR